MTPTLGVHLPDSLTRAAINLAVAEDAPVPLGRPSPARVAGRRANNPVDIVRQSIRATTPVDPGDRATAIRVTVRRPIRATAHRPT